MRFVLVFCFTLFALAITGAIDIVVVVDEGSAVSLLLFRFSCWLV